jgi:non-specific protein-tyrosine kinase
VVLICCDLRRPRLHEFFGASNAVGFTSVLLGKVPLSEALQEIPGQPRLFLLASGPLPPNPSELLASRRTAEVLRSLQSDADLVILDSPPLLPVADGLVLSNLVDATLVVTAASATSRRETVRAFELLDQVDALVIGAVLNGVGIKEAYGDTYIDSDGVEARGA